MQQARVYCQQHGKQLVVSDVSNEPFFDRFDFLNRQDPSVGQRPRYVSSSTRTCPVCKDPLQGQYGTHCPRCQWTEMDANMDSDPLSNPPDPTRDLHQGIQASRKTSDKLHDFLMNPKSRPDLQTPEGQEFLQDLERNYHNEKTDALMPWLTREWKKGRLFHGGRGIVWPGEHDLPRDVTHRWPTLGPTRVNHWADFLQSNHPLRRDLGDIMQHDVGSFHNQIHAWNQAMAQEASEQALQGGQVVHTTPDNWTVRQLTTPEELTAEGDAMGHCVGGYHPAVERGDSLIYSLRDPKGAPHATTEIRPQRWEEPGVGVTDKPYGGDQGMEQNFPIPHGGEVVQIQGKGNQEPIDEHKARLADWFRSFPPEDRPRGQNAEEPSMWDGAGYQHFTLDHPDLIPQHQEEFGGLAPTSEPVEDDYGLLHHRPAMPADYEELLKNIDQREVDWNTMRGDPAHIKSIYLLAKERGEIPELAQALQGYSEDQDEDFQTSLDNNWQHAPRYVDPADPHGWEDEDGTEVDEGQGRPYWEPEGPANIGAPRYNDPDKAEEAYDRAYGELSSQHGGLNAASEMYKLINPHYGPHPETGEQGYWNLPAGWPDMKSPQGMSNILPEAPQAPPAAPQAFASVIPSPRLAKWFEAVEDAP